MVTGRRERCATWVLVLLSRDMRTLLLPHAPANLVVLGSRRLSAVKGMLLGSVTVQVTHHAKCAVVVVPPG